MDTPLSVNKFVSPSLQQRRAEASQKPVSESALNFRPNFENNTKLTGSELTQIILKCQTISELEEIYNLSNVKFNKINWGCFFDKSVELIKKYGTFEKNFFFKALEDVSSENPIFGPQHTGKLLRLFGVIKKFELKERHNNIYSPSMRLVNFMLNSCKENASKFDSRDVYCVSQGLKMMRNLNPIDDVISNLYQQIFASSEISNQARVGAITTLNKKHYPLASNLCSGINIKELKDCELLEYVSGLRSNIFYLVKKDELLKKIADELKIRQLSYQLFCSAYWSLSLCNYSDQELNARANDLLETVKVIGHDEIDLLEGLRLTQTITETVKDFVTAVLLNPSEYKGLRNWDCQRLVYIAACVMEEDSFPYIHSLIKHVDSLPPLQYPYLLFSEAKKITSYSV